LFCLAWGWLQSCLILRAGSVGVTAAFGSIGFWDFGVGIWWNPLGSRIWVLVLVGVDALKYVEICRILFLSLCWFPNLLRFAGFLYLVDLYRMGVDYLEMDCELRLICLCFLSTVATPTFFPRSCFLDTYGPITFD
jgi:hypothetical protein